MWVFAQAKNSPGLRELSLLGTARMRFGCFRSHQHRRTFDNARPDWVGRLFLKRPNIRNQSLDVVV